MAQVWFCLLNEWLQDANNFVKNISTNKDYLIYF